VLNTFVFAGLLTATILFSYVAFKGWSVRRRSLDRLYIGGQQLETLQAGSFRSRQGWLERWLSLAGFRGESAPPKFVAITLAAALAGCGASYAYRHWLVQPLVQAVSNVPGGVGEALTATLLSGSWIVFVATACAPLLVVRATRRRRVRAIEHDLPLVLELLATMAEAGLSFDAGLSQVVRSEPRDRPLISELVTFQRDILAGVPRIDALRQLSRRVEVPSLTAFTSAVVQAERVGAGMAETLRRQAEDLRGRRREQALMLAQALPVKLVFPLVVCFLPGIFVSTLAPVIYQMIQVANSVIRSSGR
jgi:tight adherence protein C